MDPVDPRDMTETLGELQRQLQALHRPALLGATAAMIAHEFNNLLTPLLVRAQDALERDDPAAMRKACERTVAQTKKAIEICRHLMGIAATDGPGDEQTCRVADVLDEALRSIYRPLEKDGIDFRARVDPSLAVRGSPVLLHQVLLNLLLNARKALEQTRGRLTVSAAADAGYVVIDVKDSGPGFPRERMDLLLNPFLRADEDAHPRDWLSIGLGLAVCRKIAHDHGATIEALPNDGPGCTFRLRWPAA